MDLRRPVKLLGLAVLAMSAMAASASGAQAKYLLLLNKVSVAGPLNLTLTQVGTGLLVAENGLEIKCTGGSGKATETLSGTKETVISSAEAIFTGCAWVGSEKTCTINDGGKGLIKAKGSGELLMLELTRYALSYKSPSLTTVLTEGELCTIPEKEVVSGEGHLLINETLKDATSHTATLLTLTLKLGNSKVKSLSATMEVKDENASATLGIHLEKLTGCETIC